MSRSSVFDPSSPQLSTDPPGTRAAAPLMGLPLILLHCDMFVPPPPASSLPRASRWVYLDVSSFLVVESCGEEGSNTENDGRTLPHVDPPTGSGASANAWRVTADVVVKMDGTPGRVLSCTVDTQWHGTTVRTHPLRDSLWAGL